MGPACVAIAVDKPPCPRARGFKGDSARGGGRALPSVPVILRLIGGLALAFVPLGIVEVPVACTPFGKSKGDSRSSLPRACLRDFSCLFWTDRKCDKSSAHLISSRPSFDRVVEMTEVLRSVLRQLGTAYAEMTCLRFRRYVQEARRVDSVQTISKRHEG